MSARGPSLEAAGVSTADAEEHGFHDELLLLLARQSRRIPLPVFVLDLLLAVIVGARIDRPWQVWLWLAVVTLVLILRWWLLGALPGTTRLTRREKFSVAIALSAINGVVHGAAVLFLPQLDAIESSFLSILLLGYCTGTVGTTAGFLPVFLAFAAPVVVALALAWATISGEGFRHLAGWSTAIGVLLFGAVLLGMAKDAFRLFRESFEIRREQDQLNQKLRAALQDAEAANRAKTRFLASASHDLRQPMHTLTLFGAALALRPLDEESRKIARDMSAALRVLGAQLDALLDISKLDAGVVQVRPGAFFLADFLEAIGADSRRQAQSKGLKLTVRCPPNAACETDEELLARIVRNLVDNAIKYTLAGGVTITVSAARTGWRLSIADTGIGIADADREQVFEEFYQVDNPERDRSRGLGLGLSIVRRLSRLLGCEFEMSSTAGQGTEFVLSLPRANVPEEPPPPADQYGAPPSLSGLCALVLDDEETVRRGMKLLLESLGARVLLASNALEALAQARATRPDILLVDLRLRGNESGIDAVAQLRQLHPGLPALLISGDIASDRLQEAQAAGIALLHKPIVVETLCAAMERALGKKRKNHETRPSEPLGARP